MRIGIGKFIGIAVVALVVQAGKAPVQAQDYVFDSVAYDNYGDGWADNAWSSVGTSYGIHSIGNSADTNPTTDDVVQPDLGGYAYGYSDTDQTYKWIGVGDPQPVNAQHNITYSGLIYTHVAGNGNAAAYASASFNERIGEYADVLAVNWADVAGQDLNHGGPVLGVGPDVDDFRTAVGPVHHSSVIGAGGTWVQGFKTHMEVDSNARVSKQANEAASAHSGNNVMSDTALSLFQ